MKTVLRAAVVTAALLAAGSGAAPAHAQTAEQDCQDVSPIAAPCVGFEKLADAATAECRRLGLPDGDCDVPLAHKVVAAADKAYEDSWVHHAAELQYALADALPLREAPFLGTHNSFNSANADPTISHSDSNQQLSLSDQLDIDIRAIEIDIHYVPNPANGGAPTATVCHGQGPDEANFGCTTERPLTDVLPEIATWLNAHPTQVILLYLEDEIGNADGYAQTVKAIADELKRPDGSSLVFHPDLGQAQKNGCTAMPLATSRRAVRAAGAQIVIVGSCATGWAQDVYDWSGTHVESGDTKDYQPFPACDVTYKRDVYDTKLVRYYEDSTFVATAVDPTTPAQDPGRLTPEKVRSMTQCGVSLFGFDQILPDDGRLEAAIWSWAPDQPDLAGGACVVQRTDGRWVTNGCGTLRRAACTTASGAWVLSRAAVGYDGAPAACRATGATFDVPRTGYQDALLRQAAGSAIVWIRHRASTVALDVHCVPRHVHRVRCTVVAPSGTPVALRLSRGGHLAGTGHAVARRGRAAITLHVAHLTVGRYQARLAVGATVVHRSVHFR